MGNTDFNNASRPIKPEEQDHCSNEGVDWVELKAATDALTDRVGALPLQIYAWAGVFANPEFYNKALPAGVIVLLVVMLVMNSVAIVLRNRFEGAT